MHRSHHDRRVYCVAGEGCYQDISMLDERTVPRPLTLSESLEIGLTEEKLEAAYKFGRMFSIAPEHCEVAGKIEKDGLIKLGQGLNQQQVEGSAGGADSTIPSGYTYLGQFITHEITFDGASKHVPMTVMDINQVPQQRSPTIDCDSLYGAGPEDAKDAKMYEPYEGGYPAIFKLGITEQSPKWGAKLPRDLLREHARAVIGDPRNDENISLAQTHVAFVLFHNEIVKQLAPQFSGQELFEKAREQVIRHFQFIVLRDYLPRVIQPERIKEVIDYALAHNYELEFFKLDAQGGMAMPVEFSVAAFRLGHTMVRESYEWNLFHNSDKHGKATLGDFFRLTGFSGKLDGKDQLPSDWIIDWRHFYDFTEIGLKPHPRRDYNKARMLDTKFDLHLDKIFGYPHDEVPPNLRPITVRNLLRGFSLRLPTGQVVAGELKLPDKEILTEEDIIRSWDPQVSEVVKKYGFHQKTPLWYYILKEAEKETSVFKNGHRLGPVGSRILAETFVGIILNSSYSIIKDGWTPSQGVVTKKDTFSMADMLAYTNNIYPKEEEY
jgi:Animal haem peroxidase